MKSREALDDLKQWVEYITRLDYVEPEVRNEVKKLLYDAYHKTTPEFKIIEQDLEMLEFIKTHYEMNGFNELIPKYDEVDKFSELEEWLENEN